jgi:hypothetical protein
MTITKWFSRLRIPDLLSLLPLLLLLLGLGLRLYDLTDQPIDFHSTRQLRGAIVARGIYYQMSPSANETLRQQAIAFEASTGQYEPPILESLVALTYLLLGKEIFWVARIYNTLFWLLGGIALFDLARRMGEERGKDWGSVWALSSIPALLALAYYLVLPFSVQASRSFQPDPAMVVWITLAAYALYRWSHRRSLQAGQGWSWALLSGICAGMSILTKAVAIYPVGCAMIALVFYTFGSHAQNTVGRGASPSGLRFRTLRVWVTTLWDMLRAPQVWCMAVLAVGPAVIYYLTRQERASEYFSSWTLSLAHLVLEPMFYIRWLKLIAQLLTPVALLLAWVGIFFARGRSRSLLAGLWVGYILYGLFLPYQMDTHSYYHLQLVPLVAISMTPVLQMVVLWLLQHRQIWQWVAAGLAVVMLVWSSWRALVPLYGADYRNEPAYWQEIASYLPSDGKIVALTQDYGYRLMYYGWRKVTLWPNRGEIKLSILRGSVKEFDDYFVKRTEGKDYFLITAFNQFNDQPELKNELAENYPVLAKGPGYLIFDLRPR